jgi:RNA polymerase primary sigma factor
MNQRPLRLLCAADEEVGDREGIDARLIEDARQIDVSHELIRQELCARVNEALATLPERDREAIRLRIGLADGHSHTLQGIGKTLSLSGERIRQIENQSILRLRTLGISRRLHAILG